MPPVLVPFISTNSSWWRWRWRGWASSVRIGFSVYQPGVELARAAGNLFENHLDGLVGDYRVIVDLAKKGVVPGGPRRHPLRLPMLVFIFHDHTQPSVADSLFRRS